MKISFDAEADAIYIRFVDEPFQVTTHRLSQDVAVNCAPERRIIGIEILDASSYVFRPGMKGQIEVDNLRTIASQPQQRPAEILGAIAAMTPHTDAEEHASREHDEILYGTTRLRDGNEAR